MRMSHRLCILLAVLSLCTRLDAAQFRGQILLNEKGGQPVANVEIRAIGANPTVSDRFGEFTLEFPDKRPGDTVHLTLFKRGYEIVHYFFLEQVLRNDGGTVELLMCKEGNQEEMFGRFFRLKELEAAEATYRQRTKEMEERRQGDYAALAQLRRERDQAIAEAERAAEELAKVRAGEGSEVYEQAMRLFLEGKVGEALGIVDEGKLEQRRVEGKGKPEELSRDYMLRGRLLTLKFRFPEAEKAYEAAVETDPDSFEANFALARFHQDMNHYAQARTAYSRSLELARKKGSPEDVAATLNEQGVLRSGENRMKEARQAYDESLKIRRKLAEQNPDVYLRDVVVTLNNLGAMHYQENRMGEGRQAYEEGLNMARELAEENPDVYLPYLAATLNNMGGLHYKENRMEEARQVYEEALKIHRKLAEQNPRVYLRREAATLNNLSLVHSDEKRMEEARDACEESLNMYRKLAAQNPDAYLPYVATTLNNLGNLHRKENRMEEAREAYEESLAIYEKFAKASSARFNGDVQRVRRLLEQLTKSELK